MALVAQGDPLRARLRENAAFFRAQLTALGFRLIPGEHPIIPVMFGDAALATRMAERLLEEGVFAPLSGSFYGPLLLNALSEAAFLALFTA